MLIKFANFEKGFENCPLSHFKISIIHFTQCYSNEEMYPLLNGVGNNFLTVLYKEKYKIYKWLENPYFF